MPFFSKLHCLFAIVAVALFPAILEAQSQSSARGNSPANTFRIAGTVVSKTDGHPLAGARVMLTSVKNRQKRQSVATGEDGKFDFTGVPAGKYSLAGARRGFITAGYDQHDQYASAIVTGAGIDTENLVLKLAPDAIISGRVLDETGEPVRNANVTLYFDDHQEGLHQIHTNRGAQTDDLGAFEMPSLTPGTYYLSVTATPWYAVHPERNSPQSQSAVDPALDVSYPVTYYSDVTDADSATPIVIHGGEHLQFDVHLSPSPSLHILVHVPVTRNGQMDFPQLEQVVFGDSVPTQNTGARMVVPGTWEISGIPAGHYNIHLNGPSANAEISGIDLSSNSQELDASAGEALCTVKMSVARPDSTNTPGFLVALRSKNRTFPGFFQGESKDEVHFQNVPAGRYEVVISGPGRQYSIAQLSAEGADVSGHTVTLGPGATASLSLAVSLGGAEVEGVAKREGKGFSGAMIVLVPNNPGVNLDLFRRDQSDLDGTFVFHNVAPGTYTVVAIEDGWDLDWSQPEIIASYAKRGVPLRISEKSGQTLQLPASVEVQPK